MQPTIFVSIPSYRDPECQYTVLDLFRKAKHPQRVYVGICWQADRQEDAACFQLDFGEYEAQIRTSFIHHSEARGPCFARAMIQRELFRGEDFYLQLDSHYRMVVHWDEELLEQLHRCPSQRAVLTTYPSSYTLPDDYKPGQPDAARLNPKTDPIVVCAREFNAADGFLRTAGKLARAEAFHGQPVLALFWAAGFAFSVSSVIQEVPYDPSLEDLFFGEEPSMAARLWTSGWDFYAPSRVLGFHLWTRKHRPIFREHACAEQRCREAASQARVRRMLGISEGETAEATEASAVPDAYGLGHARSLADYEAFSGVGLVRRKLSLRARRGGLDPDAFVDGDPAAPPVGAAAVPAGLASLLGMPILGAMPSQVTEAIQGLVGPGTSEAVREGPTETGAPPCLLQLGENSEKLQLLRAKDVEELNRCGVVVLDHFLEERCWASCGGEAAAESPFIVREAALQVPLRPARLGREGQFWSSAAVRGDEMAWLSVPEGCGLLARAESRVREGRCRTATGSVGTPQPAAVDAAGPGSAEFDALQAQLRSSFGDAAGHEDSGENRSAAFYEGLDVLLTKLVQLRSELDEVLALGSTRTSVMLARYPGGGTRYARHRDASPEQPRDSRRRLTLVYYLNPSWLPEHGGCLRAYLPPSLGPSVPGAKLTDTGGEWVLDVEPRWDRLVVFASEWLEHEVLPAHAERCAITMWLY